MTEVGRRLMAAACVLLAAFVLALGIGARAGSAATACDRPCSQGAASARSGAPAQNIPCIRDAACSGGFVLGGNSGAVLVLVLPAALAALVLPVNRIRRRRVLAGAIDRLLDGGRFHPPQVLLGS